MKRSHSSRPCRARRYARPLIVHVLAPAGMALHSAAHLFHGDCEYGLRDLLLERSLFYALRYGYSLLGTAVPAVPSDAVACAAPPAGA